MKRFLAPALIISISTFGLVGCEEKTQDKTVQTTETPNGTVKKTDTTTIEKTGGEKDNK